MNTAQQKLQSAMQYAMANRPAVGGFPFLAECLRRIGVKKNIWSLPSAQSVYIMEAGTVVQQGQPLVSVGSMTDVPAFDEAAVIAAVRTDQAGKSTFPEFLTAIWHAGVIGYEVDFEARAVAYYGARSAGAESKSETDKKTEVYIEAYSAVEVSHDGQSFI